MDDTNPKPPILDSTGRPVFIGKMYCVYVRAVARMDLSMFRTVDGVECSVVTPKGFPVRREGGDDIRIFVPGEALGVK